MQQTLQRMMSLLGLLCLVLAHALAAAPKTSAVPTANKIYRLWNVQYSKLMYETDAHALYAKDAPATTDGSTDLTSLFLLEKVSGVDNGYRLRNVSTGRYVTMVSADRTSYPTGYDPAVFIIKKNTVDTVGYNLLHYGDESHCMHEDDVKRIVRWYPTTTNSPSHPSEWLFEAVDETEEMRASLKNHTALLSGIYRIVNAKPQNGASVYATVDEQGQLAVVASGTAKPAWNQLFIIRQKNNGSTSIQSLSNGLFVQRQEGDTTYYTAASEAELKVEAWNGSGTTASYYNIYNVSRTNALGWTAANGKIIKGNTSGTDTLTSAEWKFEPDSTLGLDEIRTQLNTAKGYAAPDDTASYYRIVSAYYNRYMQANTSSNIINTATKDNSQYLQVWKLVKLSNGNYTLRNSITGQYVNNNPTQSQRYPLVSDQPATGFTLRENKTDIYQSTYEFVDSNPAWGLHCAQSQDYDVVAWTPGSGGNQWYFEKATIDEQVFNSQKTDYDTRMTILNSTAPARTTLARFFKDKACTELRETYSTMTAEDFRKVLDSTDLLDFYKTMAMKVQQKTWKVYPSGKHWEEFFRVADYKPYSNHDVWSDKMGTSNSMGHLTGPTGIYTTKGQWLQIYVDTVPANCYMQCSIVPLGTNNGPKTTLEAGVNNIYATASGTVFINYVVNTHDNKTTDGVQHKLADFPTVKIHVEGGDVNGYFDLTRDMTNEDWKKMVEDSLVVNDRPFQGKGYLTLWHARGEHVKNGSYNYNHSDKYPMVELIKEWDFIINTIEGLMGFREKYKDYMNCLMNGYAVNSGLYASTGGLYLAWYAWPSEVANFQVLNTGTGKLWVQGHEFGHNHQRLINTMGMTEISNNLFSNAVLNKYGRSTSRGGGAESSTETYAKNHIARKHWVDYGTWGCTQMYYKLYLYYHAAKNDTTFFPHLFQELYDHPLTRRNQGAGITYGYEDYLRLALACCKVAKEDLSDFFDHYGFFVPADRTVGDYSTYHLVSTQAQIDSIRTLMHGYPKGKAADNLIFISDRIRPVQAEAWDSQPGEMRQAYSSEDAPGNVGDLGQYQDFTKDKTIAPTGSILSANFNDKDSTMTFITKDVNNGVAGFKVLDDRDSIVYVANTLTFTVPKSVIANAGGKLKVVLVAANGKDATIFESDKNEVNHFGSNGVKVDLKYVDCSDQETIGEQGQASKAVDGDEKTLWHTVYRPNQKAYPHWITLENVNRENITRIDLHQRPTESYHATRVNIYTSDDKTNFTKVDSINIPNEANVDLLLPHAVKARYIKLEFTKGRSNLLAIHEIFGLTDSYPVNVGNTGYATLYINHPVVLPDGLKASTLTLEGDALKASREYGSGQTVPAYTAMLLSGASKAYELTYDSVSTTEQADNNLHGTLADSVTSAGTGRYYALSLNAKNEPGSVGFYWMNSNGAAFTNAAHKAYLFVPSTVSSAKSGYRLDNFTTTGIATALGNDEDADDKPLFNVAGQRVDDSYNGVVISKGGKKINVRKNKQ